SAEKHYRKTIKLKPGHALAQFNLGFVLTLKERFIEAARHYKLAYDADPEFTNALSQYWHMQMKTCNWSDYASLEYALTSKLIPLALQAKPGSAGFRQVFSPFTLINVQDNPQHARLIAEDFINIVARNNSTGLRLYTGKENKSLHAPVSIAFLSTDFRAHPTSFLIVELFEIIDKHKFDVHIVSIGEDDKSGLRARIKASGCHFHDFKTLADLEIAQNIASLGIDILVDLNGLTTGARPDILAFRPAPLQINYLAYPGTMGADFIDYIIADKFVLPASLQDDFTEEIMYMPGCYQVNDRHPHLSSTTPTRSECGLPETGYVLCCFNSNYKITPAIFSIWMEVLAEFPDSVLWLLKSNAEAMENLRESATNSGIDPDRLVFADVQPIDEHLSRIGHADLFLDTHPCVAHTTASDALRSAVPIVTLAGRGFPSRVCGSLLTNVGLSELITYDYEQYKLLVVTLLRNPEQLAHLRKQLEDTVGHSVLFDTETFVRGFEQGLQHIATRDRKGLKPETFFVEDLGQAVHSDNQEKGNPQKDIRDQNMNEQPLKINITQIQPENSNYGMLLQEFRETLICAFSLMEFDCSTLENDFIDDGLNIILGAHLLTDEEYNYVPANSVIYNTEQIVPEGIWTAAPFVDFLNRHEIWNISEQSNQVLKGLGVRSLLQHVPVGTVPQLNRIPVADNQNIDILICTPFVPDVSDMVNELTTAGLSVHVLTEVYGQDLDRFIARSKIILWPGQVASCNPSHPWIAYVLSNSKVVVYVASEDDEGQTDLQSLMITTQRDLLVETCGQLAAEDGTRRQLEKLAGETMTGLHQAIYLHQALQTIGGTSANAEPASNPSPLKLNFYAGDGQKNGCINCSTIAGYEADAVIDPSSTDLVNSTLRTASFGQVTLEADQFDEIILDDVLASTHDLISTMTNCLNLLKPGGELKITVPYDLSYAAWENPLNVRAFNERSWDIYTQHYTSLGWVDACFSTSAMDVTFSPLGEELIAKDHPVDAVLTQPRAVDQLQVVLTKCDLSNEASTHQTLPIHNFPVQESASRAA
nr:hypothetical protein [Granulosicoccus sp.]